MDLMPTITPKTPSGARSSIVGLGDVVAIVAQPVAKVIDVVAGTKLASCGGCKARRDKWNQKFPLRQPI